MHRIISEHPAMVELDRQGREIVKRRQALLRRRQEEDVRLARERREYTAAVDRGDVDAVPPSPGPDLGQAMMTVMQDAQVLDRKRRDALRDHATELERDLDAAEASILRSLADNGEQFRQASGELRNIIETRNQIRAARTPGSSRATTPPCDPSDVLRAVLDGRDSLPGPQRSTEYHAVG